MVYVSEMQERGSSWISMYFQIDTKIAQKDTEFYQSGFFKAI